MTTTTQTRARTHKNTLAAVARFAHVSVRDVEAAVNDPDSVTRDTLAVVREAAQEVGFDMAAAVRAAARSRRKKTTQVVAPDGLPRTRSGLRKLDPTPLVEQGRKQAHDELGHARADAAAFYEVNVRDEDAIQAAKDAWFRVLAKASRMVEATDAEIAKLRPKRDAAMLSLFLLDGKRGVDQAAGLSPTTWYDMRRETLGVKGMGNLTAEQRAELARKQKIRHVKNAADVIADVAPRVLVLNGCREEAFAVQKHAALHLHSRLGVSEPEIRAVTGRSEDTFWQWRHQEQKRRRADQAERGKAS